MEGDAPIPEAPRPISGRSATLTALAGVLGAVALMLLLVTWAATIGPEEVVRGEGNPPTNATLPSPPTPTPSEQPDTSTLPQGGGDQDLLITAVTLVAVLLASVVMLAVVLSVLRWLVSRDWRLRTREREPEDVDFDPLEAPAVLAGAMLDDAPAQRDVLAGGSARNAIVACWHRFEEQAAAAGVRRNAWETSSEFTMRILDRLSADSAAVMALAELYRAARHSTHEITEDDRAEARVALDVVHRSMGATTAFGGRRPA